MGVDWLLQRLGDEITDAEEETFILFAQSLPSRNLGFIDSKAASLQVAVGSREFTVHQSPTLLASERSGGTTGAVVWAITVPFAEWISSPTNILLASGVLDAASAVLELGCGVSALIGRALAPHVARYVLTDQAYVGRLVADNIREDEEGTPEAIHAGAKGRKRGKKSAESDVDGQGNNETTKLVFTPLDWETDAVQASLTSSAAHDSFDAVLACDCVYNDALISPLVQACAAACCLRSSESSTQPCVCIIAQQLRSPDVFQSWLAAFLQDFRVWRVPDAELLPELWSDRGFVVHIGVVRS